MAAQFPMTKLGSQGPGLSCGQDFLTLVPVGTIWTVVDSEMQGISKPLCGERPGMFENY